MLLAYAALVLTSSPSSATFSQLGYFWSAVVSCCLLLQKMELRRAGGCCQKTHLQRLSILEAQAEKLRLLLVECDGSHICFSQLSEYGSNLRMLLVMRGKIDKIYWVDGKGFCGL